MTHKARKAATLDTKPTSELLPLTRSHPSGGTTLSPEVGGEGACGGQVRGEGTKAGLVVDGAFLFIAFGLF